MAIHIVVPARLASTRLPDKPLALIDGVPMVVRVLEQVAQCRADDVIAAVDDERVFAVVDRAGFKAVMTDVAHTSGSDRVFEVVGHMGWSDDDVVINVQGDEPLIPPDVVNRLIDEMLLEEDAPRLATLMEPIRVERDFLDANVVKAVPDERGYALYFSRAPVPYPRDGVFKGAWRHVGVYAFTASALREFTQLPASTLETTEMLEQLRWLSAGLQIKLVALTESVPGGVDTPEDLLRVTAAISQMPG